MAHTSSLLSRRILHFLAVFEHGTVHQAADKMGVSQPALSMSLKQLEHELQVQLFERQARGVVPTEAGQVLYRYASSMRQGARLASEEIEALRAGLLSRLRLGAGVAWTTTVLPSVLTDLHTHFPGMAIDIITGVGDQLAALFLAGAIDVFLAAGSMPSLDVPDIEKEFVANLPMKAVSDPLHELARLERVSPADLVATSWAGFYEDEGFAHLAQHYLALRGLPAPTISMRTNSAAALTALVRGTDLVAILISPLASAARVSGLVDLPLSEPLWDMPVNIYYRRMAADVGSIRVFRERVRTGIQALVS